MGWLQGCFPRHMQRIDVMLWPADDMLTLFNAPNECKLISTSETRKVIYGDLSFIDEGDS
jgi:hypothetical protein